MDGKPVVIYGAGAHTARYLNFLQQLNIVALADKDPILQGKKRFDFNIIAPDAVETYAADVVISSKAWEGSIIEDLQRTYEGRLRCHGLYEGDQEMAAYLEQVAEDAARAVDRVMPDILIYSPAHPSERLPAAFFLELKHRHPHLKILTVWWDHDEAAAGNSYMSAERESLSFADYVIENSAGTRIDRMRRREIPYQAHHGAEKVHFNPTPFDPDLFYPATVEKSYDISIMGSPVGNRRELIAKLEEDFQDQFHHWGGVYMDRPPLPMPDYAEKIRRSRILINSQTFSFAPQCKGKVRETLSCGGFLLEEDNPEPRLFVPEGKGVIFYRDYEDLAAKITYFAYHDIILKLTLKSVFHFIDKIRYAYGLHKRIVLLKLLL